MAETNDFIVSLLKERRRILKVIDSLDVVIEAFESRDPIYNKLPGVSNQELVLSELNKSDIPLTLASIHTALSREYQISYGSTKRAIEYLLISKKAERIEAPNTYPKYKSK